MTNRIFYLNKEHGTTFNNNSMHKKEKSNSVYFSRFHFRQQVRRREKTHTSTSVAHFPTRRDTDRVQRVHLAVWPKSRRSWFSMYLPFFYTLLLLLTSLEQPISAANQPHRYANKHGPSSVIFPVTGNVYPKGYVVFNFIFSGFFVFSVIIHSWFCCGLVGLSVFYSFYWLVFV